MDERLSQRLRERVGRRSFLKGSRLLAVSVLAATLSQTLAAQPEASQDQNGGRDEDRDAAKDTTRESPSKDPNAPTEDVFLAIHKDESGRDYRVCPQCGFNMYKQDRTWTCENCGFSYTE